MEFRTFLPTQTQLRMLEATSAVGNLCAVFRLEGELDIKRLSDAVKAVINRTDPFSFRFVKMNESLEILQSSESPEGLRVIDLANEDEANAYQLIRSLCNRSFRLDGGSPYFFSLLKGRDFQFLVFACHPALIDRFSLKPLFRVISEAYQGHEISSQLGLSQESLIKAEAQLLKSPKYPESIRFWLQLLKETAFEWKPARLESELSDTYFSSELSQEATHSVVLLAEQLQMGVGELLLCCFHLFLFRMTRNEMIVTSHHHRIRDQEKIGFSENKPEFKSQIQAQMSARKFFKNAKRLFAQAQYHSDLPAREVHQELRRSDPDFERTTNVVFDSDNLPFEELSLEGVRCTLLPSFSDRLDNEDFSIHFEYSGQSPSRIVFHVLCRSPQHTSGMKIAFEHYISLLENIRKEIDTPVGSLTLFTDATRKRAIQLAEGGPLKVPARDIVDSLLSVAALRPNRPAISFLTKKLNYGELVQSAKNIARTLLPYVLHKEDPIIGICLSRSEVAIEAIFGVLFAGGAYLPLDPKTPAERLAFTAEDSGLSAVIVDGDTHLLIEPLVRCPVIQLKDILPLDGSGASSEDIPDELPVRVPPQRAAYVIYTSGTTGKPKGVVLERGMVAHYIASMEGVWSRGPGCRWLQFASFNFDASVLEIFNALTQGAELVVAPDEVRTDPEALFNFLQNERITQACLPPALLLLLPRRPLPDLKGLYFGGEALDEEASRFWSKVIELGNCYGPTECTVMATFNVLKGYKAAVHLGRPMRGYQTYLLDDRSELTPLCGVGEICIGGESVAREYLGRPELTSQKFIRNPYGPGRLYRTGDLARFLPNGDIEFLGRNDFQVKLRGFRIELTDIENAISEQPEVNGSYVAILNHGGTKALTAWYVANNLAPETLRKRVSERLPHYMVPTFLVRMGSFPLNINGKIDRTKLPAPRSENSQETLPLDDFENHIRKIWANVLKIDPNAIGLNHQFFHLGGHSLLAALVCSRIHVELGIAVRPKLLFDFPVFADFCSHTRTQPKGAFLHEPVRATALLSVPVENRMSKLIYSRTTAKPNDNTYNVVTRIEFSGDIHPLRLRQALRELLAENPIFHSFFYEVQNQIQVEKKSDCKIAIPLMDVTYPIIDERVQLLCEESIGVSKSPLWRAEVLCTEDGRTTLLFSVHHIIFDGWSLNLMLEELSVRYEAIVAGRKFSRVRLTWFDYCQWEFENKANPNGKLSTLYSESILYWREKLQNTTARIELPLAAHQRKDNSNVAMEVRFEPKVVQLLKLFADDLGVTLPPLVFSLFLVWLWRLSNQEEMICAYPYAGRDLPGTEEIFGTFVVMPYLRQKIAAEQTLRDLTLEVHRQMLNDKEHLSAAPYEAEIPGMDSLNVIFSLQMGIDLTGAFAGSNYKIHELPSKTSKGDIAAILYPGSDGSIEGRLEYDSSVFENEVMSCFTEHFITLVSAAASHPNRRVGELRYQSEEQLRRFIELSSGKEFEIPDSSIVQRFSEITTKYPERIALIFQNSQLTYRELDSWSNQIAAALPTELKAETTVGLSVVKGEALIAALLGILKRGFNYVPLDTSYPADRLRYFVENSGLSHIVADAKSIMDLRAAGLVEPKYLQPIGRNESFDSGVNFRSNLNPSLGDLPYVAPESLAYMIYTSGSTGLPKGVMIEHSSVVRMVVAAAQELGLEDYGGASATALKSTLISSVNFDASVLEIFLPLLNGGTLIVIPESTRKDPNKLHEALNDSGATMAILSPVVLQNLPRQPLPRLKIMAFGGDVLDESAAQWWSGQTRLFSLYGPTEMTVMASMGEIKPNSNHRVIGRPLAGYRTYLLNREKQPVPVGAIGEICIAGESSARGYLGRKDLTMDRFVLDPFGASPYSTMYLSGDLGRFLNNGQIEFLGRNDSQVKLRGFRIELGEIENHLSSLPGIGQAVCAVKGEGENKHLVAYYVEALRGGEGKGTLDVGGTKELSEEYLRDRLSVFLPDYMVPSFFVRMDILPASVNGKLDRKSLPDIVSKANPNPPHEGIERQIADIWEKILQFKGIGRTDSFFHMGGNSLLAVRMQIEVKKHLNMSFSLADFYRAPSIQALAAKQEQDHIALAIEDANLENDNLPSDQKYKPAHIKKALLTGATGFLGIYLLAELCSKLDKVYCLVRCDSAELGMKSIGDQARAANLDMDFTRVEVIPGDLSRSGLGLSPVVWDELASEIDIIVHCGALVHHLHSYSFMKAANVSSTKELLALALEKKIKPFCFVSTLTVGAAIEGANSIVETILPNRPVVDNGYLLTKWVGEQLVVQANRKFGLPAVIARPGNITGNSVSGFTNFSNNHFWLFNKGCLQIGNYPDMPAGVEMVPVDILARAIGALAVSGGLSDPKDLLVANLCNPKSLTQKEFFEKLVRCGYEASPLPPAEWQRHLSSLNEQNALSAIKDFYSGDLTGPTPAVEQSRTLAVLGKLGIRFEVDYDKLIPVYVSYLKKAGFLEYPELRGRKVS